MFTSPDLQIRIAEDRLEELRRQATRRRLVRLARALRSEVPTRAAPTVETPATLDGALRLLGELVERAGQPVPERAVRPVRRLVADLITVADRHGVAGTPAAPARRDPMVVALRAAGTLARRAIGHEIAFDGRSGRRIADRLDDVRKGFGLPPASGSRPSAVVSLGARRPAEGRAA